MYPPIDWLVRLLEAAAGLLSPRPMDRTDHVRQVRMNAVAVKCAPLDTLTHWTCDGKPRELPLSALFEDHGDLYADLRHIPTLRVFIRALALADGLNVRAGGGGVLLQKDAVGWCLVESDSDDEIDYSTLREEDWTHMREALGNAVRWRAGDTSDTGSRVRVLSKA